MTKRVRPAEIRNIEGQKKGKHGDVQPRNEIGNKITTKTQTKTRENSDKCVSYGYFSGLFAIHEDRRPLRRTCTKISTTVPAPTPSLMVEIRFAERNLIWVAHAGSATVTVSTPRCKLTGFTFSPKAEPTRSDHLAKMIPRAEGSGIPTRLVNLERSSEIGFGGLSPSGAGVHELTVRSFLLACFPSPLRVSPDVLG